MLISVLQINLTWSSDKAHPGEQVSLTVTLGETMSQVGIMVMGTHDDATQADVEAKLEEVYPKSEREILLFLFALQNKCLNTCFCVIVIENHLI